MSILDDEEVLKKRQCKRIMRSNVKHSRVKHLWRGAREREIERVTERERDRFFVFMG